MFIGGINLNQPICIKSNCRSNNVKQSKVNFCGVPSDMFVSDAATAIKKLKMFTTEEYKLLSDSEKKCLRNEYEKMKYPSDVRIETFHDEFTDTLMNKLNRKYGKDNYTVIFIGRSLSSIGKVLGYKIGEENVKNIPMSDAKQYLDDNHLKKLKKEGQIEKFNKYLSTIGLTKEKVEQSGKKYVITDFCIMGTSLEGATKLLKREDVLGEKNIVSKDVLKYITNPRIRNRAKHNFLCCEFKSLSFVKYSGDLKNLENKVTDTESHTYKTRLLWFKLLDNQMLKI